MNLGVTTYNSNQELILLIQLLKTGKRPTTAVFYDGINDALVGALDPSGASGHWDVNIVRSRLEVRSEFWKNFVGLDAISIAQFGGIDK